MARVVLTDQHWQDFRKERRAGRAVIAALTCAFNYWHDSGSSMSSTNDHWAALIQIKVAEVISDPSRLAPSTYESGSYASVSQFIDHTLLRPEATAAQIDTLCEEAIKHNFKVRSRCFSLRWSLTSIELR